MASRTCIECGKDFDVEPGPSSAARTLCSDVCRRAVRARRQREYTAAQKAKRPPKRLRPFDPNPDGIRCAAEDCSKVLTVAALAGGSEHCSRTCAGFPTPQTEHEREREPTGADLEGVAA